MKMIFASALSVLLLISPAFATSINGQSVAASTSSDISKNEVPANSIEDKNSPNSKDTPKKKEIKKQSEENSAKKVNEQSLGTDLEKTNEHLPETSLEKTKEQSPETGLEKAKELGSEAVEKTQEVVKKGVAILDSARENRASSAFGVAVNYSLFDTWIPSKYGASLLYNRSASSTYELEYLRASISYDFKGLDIGKISEQRLSLLWRSYSTRNSFSFNTGLNYSMFNIHVGDSLLSSVAPNERSSVDIINIRTLGFTWGVGNRWQTANGVVWGFDWFTINIPLHTVESESPFLSATTKDSDRDKVDDLITIFRHLPTFSILKAQLGYSF